MSGNEGTGKDSGKDQQGTSRSSPKVRVGSSLSRDSGNEPRMNQNPELWLVNECKRGISEDAI